MLSLRTLWFRKKVRQSASHASALATTIALAISFSLIPAARGQESPQPVAPQPAQQSDAPEPKPEVKAAASSQQAASPGGAPLRLTLQDALTRARANSTTFLAAVTQSGVAREDNAQARNALLPSVTYNNQAIYTQTNRSSNGVVFIANNGAHEYISQGNVHEAIDLASVYNWRRASAGAAVARAKAEIASRGLVVTVVQGYYGVAAAQQKLDAARRAADEGEHFLKITSNLEHGGEVAHSDVIKADLQDRERRRQLQEAQLGLLNARLDLSVLIFPDFNDNFEVADDLHAAVPIPTLAEVQQQAARDNPDVRAAVAAAQEAGNGVMSARAGYLPALSFDYFYGIDASRFAVNSVESGKKISNLGSSAMASVTIPVWNWGSTQSKVKQAELQRTQAQHELSFAQRKLLAEIQSLYAEAETALNELGDLSRSADLSLESLRLTTLRYQNGEATVLEVVDAQNTFALASNAYQDGAVRYRVSLASLQTLTGALTTP